MYKMNQSLRRWRSLAFILPLVLLFSFVLVACGSNYNTNVGSSGTTATVTATRTAIAATGCPDKTVITTPPPAATVVLKNSDSNKLVSVNQGNTVEIDLPTGHLWDSPTGDAPTLLTPQPPSGYALLSSQACVWRFLAAGAGTVHLTFIGRPICKMGQACPMYVMAVPFNIQIK